MSDSISHNTLENFSNFIARTMGLQVQPARWPELARALTAIARDLEYEQAEQCALQLISEPLTERQMGALANHLTVGETYFFREPAAFEALVNRMVPELMRRRREGARSIRIWSAACCTGEEPYSIAMALHESIPDLSNWNISILASDISPRSIEKAKKGVFGPWSFRGAPIRMKDRYFQPAGGGQFAILPEIQKLVRFFNLNLAGDGYPAADNGTAGVDIIFCRNVLMYFTPMQADRVLDKLFRAQAEGGWLILGAVEMPQASAHRYGSVRLGDFGAYQKEYRALTQWERDAKYVGPVPASPIPLPHHRETAVAETVEDSAAPSACPDSVEAAENEQELERSVRILSNAGRLNEAMACCDQWIRRDPLSAPAHFLRALIFQEQGEFEKAARSLRGAIYLDSTFVMAHFALGTLARQRDRHREALKHFAAALRLAARCRDDEVLPESGEMTAGQFARMVHSMQVAEATT